MVRATSLMLERYLFSAGREKRKDTRMHKGQAKEDLKKQLSALFKSMDFVNNNFLDSEKISKKEFQVFFNIYQQLGLAWEFLGLQCKHWDGYKKTRDNKETCKICGEIMPATGDDNRQRTLRESLG
jgi:hypothetical protein